MILKCCSQYVSKLGNLSSGHRQHWKRAAFILIPKKDNTKESSNYHTNLLISHVSKVILQARLEAVHEPRSSKLDLEKAKKNQRSNCQHPLDHSKSKRIPEKLLYLLAKAFDCMDHNRLWKILRDGYSGPPYLFPEKLVWGQEARIRTFHRTTYWERSTSRLYIVNMLIYLPCRVHHVKWWAGWLKSWNQDCQEKNQQPQICRW